MDAQGTLSKIPDSIRDKDFDYIFNRIEDRKINDGQRSIYLQSFLIKAKSEKDWEELSNAYKNYVHYAPEKLKLTYADSMVAAAKQSKDNEIIGAAYLSKGVAYYRQKRLAEALDSYLIADTYITRTTDKYQFYKVKYNIGLIKFYLGFYGEAIALFEECIDFFNKDDVRGYLNSLHMLGACYNMVGNHGLCSEVNEKGISEGHRLDNTDMESYFVHSEGVNQCKIHNFALSIEKIKAALPAIHKAGDFANEAIGYFYLGKSYWGLGNKELAISYFKKMDQIYDAKDYLRPDMREGYELMISHYESIGLQDVQLYYVKKLLNADRMLHKTYTYLQGKIHKEYDTKKLKQQKNEIENSLRKRRYNDQIFISVIVGLCLFVIAIIIRYLKNKKVTRRKYEELLQKLEASKKAKSALSEENGMSMSKDAEAMVLSQLKKFEDSKKFREKDLTLTKLAGFFNTNPKYLSEIISKHRLKSFNNYLNGLKVNYIAEKIRNERMLQNFTDKALGDEAGFSSTRRFVNAFETQTGISPREFIDELKKDDAGIK
ncbi:helix-turn-helix domain-containing protein [Flavobacterium sp.]|uniref:helix-turn-helix domain-containing protein n=1 Tax=Flavobacterium sp. TaxID=239 RepID=UPI004033B080